MPLIWLSTISILNCHVLHHIWIFTENALVSHRLKRSWGFSVNKFVLLIVITVKRLLQVIHQCALKSCLCWIGVNLRLIFETTKGGETLFNRWKVNAIHPNLKNWFSPSQSGDGVTKQCLLNLTRTQHVSSSLFFFGFWTHGTSLTSSSCSQTEAAAPAKAAWSVTLGGEWQRQGSRFDWWPGWKGKEGVPSYLSHSPLSEARRVGWDGGGEEGGGCNSRVQVSLCGQCGRRGGRRGRWELWELRGDKEQRGSLVVCVIAPKCIFLFLVIPFSVWPADDLIPPPPTHTHTTPPPSLLLLSYSGAAGERTTGQGRRRWLEASRGNATRNVIKNSRLIGFFHDKAQSSHT